MLQLCLRLLFLGTLIQAEPYQPGTPGMYIIDVILNQTSKFLEVSRSSVLLVLELHF